MDVRLGDLDKRDIGRSYELRTRAFGPLPDAVRAQWEVDLVNLIDEHRALAAYDGDLLIARAIIWPFSQFWGGRELPMAGVAGVVVAPDYRARGVGTALMTATAERGRSLGFPVSVLYPATVPVYRRTGWEIAGAHTRITVTTRFLRELRGGDVRVRSVGPEDAATLVAMIREVYGVGRANGPRGYRADDLVKRLEDDSLVFYAADDGFVSYGWKGNDILVHQLVAGSAGTARALWAVVGSSSSVAENVHAYAAPDDSIHQLLGECVREEVTITRWMLRLLDVEAAVAGRGFPAGLTADIPVVLEDPLLPDNAFAGRLKISDGGGELVADDAARSESPVVLGPNGLAALYAGTPTGSLLSSGLVTGGTPANLALLDAAFVGRPAYLLEYF